MPKVSSTELQTGPVTNQTNQAAAANWGISWHAETRQPKGGLELGNSSTRPQKKCKLF